ncbi:MAG: leucyl aminopeptidase family protein, partial [Rhizobiales bacterium]|nr:leucyl aminopeptidase family protein [Hyphomicrobiales bacterium]
MSELKDLLVEDAPDAVDVFVTGEQGLDEATAAIGGNAPAWIASSGYKPVPGSHLLVPGADGTLAGVIAGTPSTSNPFAPLALGRLADALPSGTYRLARPPEHADLAALGWLLGAYRFTNYHSGEDEEPAARLVMPQGGERAHVVRVAEGCHRTMDLVNLPANDLGPDALAQAVKQLAADYGASASETVGDDLIAANLPLIHAVGRASAQAPRLVDFTWGDPSAPKVTLVGKGVTFDTGGLDLKPSSAMLLMKKDMGGAANVLGLAQMIMDAGLNLRLRVLVPIVENSVAGAAFRPGDVLTSRKGLTVEIGNTDAEGRLILADA